MTSVKLRTTGANRNEDRAEKLNQYLSAGIKEVEGWLDEYSAKFIASLARIQLEAGYDGAAGEIGVYHGKLFLILHLTSPETQPCFAIDVFEQRHHGSGYGNLRVFLKNVRRWSGPSDNVAIIRKSSLNVLPEDVVARCGHCRLVSIDGGHTEECVVNDLRLAEAVLHEHGVAIVDDYFNQSWPSVSVGVIKHCLNPRARLRPFAISPNKLYLASPDHADFYRKEILDLQSKHYHKDGDMLGGRVDIYGLGGANPSRIRSAANTLKAKHPGTWHYVQRVRNGLSGLRLR